MTKLFPILFATLFFIQSINIHFADVLQWREFIEHANLHREKYGDSFAVFISKHYGELKESHEKQHQQEEKEHHHDPISHDCKSQIHIDIAVHIIDYSLKTIPFINHRKTNFYYQDKFYAFEKQKIFQPPRV